MVVTGQQDGITNYGYIPVYTPGLDGAKYLFGGNPVYTYRPEASMNPDLKAGKRLSLGTMELI